jgi:hypothetical protein
MKAQLNIVGRPSEYDVFAIEMGCTVKRDEELTPVGVSARICHGKEPPLRVFTKKILIIEFTPIYGLATLRVKQQNKTKQKTLQNNHRRTVSKRIYDQSCKDTMISKNK